MTKTTVSQAAPSSSTRLRKKTTKLKLAALSKTASKEKRLAKTPALTKKIPVRRPSISRRRSKVKNISEQFNNNAILSIEKLHVAFNDSKVLKEINIQFPTKGLVAIMGPSGCGKSTLIRAINRMHDLDENASVHGVIRLGDKNIIDLPAMTVRQHIGMVFQRPNPFPNMTIFQNVLSGYILTNQRLKRPEKERIVEENLRKAFLWDEVKDRLHHRSTFLSGGQQQRLCIARSLAMKIELLLLDEPTSALDPLATARIENLLENLKKEIPIIMVTHNTAQASRISDYTAFLYLGELIEYNKTKIMFTVPSDKRTEAYLMGRFG